MSRPLLAALLSFTLPASPALAAGQARAQTGRAGTARASVGAGASISAGAGLTVPQLTPSLQPLSGAPALAPTPANLAAAAALPASAITPIDPSRLPDKGRDYSGAEWAKLAASAPGEGARAVLRTMRPGSNPQLTVTMADGSAVSGSFLGLAGDKLAFSAAGGKLLGVDMNTRDIVEVRRMADVWFDGGTLRPEEVVVHSRPKGVADPFRDLDAFKGQELELDVRDLDDLKWSAQTVSGRLVSADGDEILLDGPKGRTHVSKEFHRVDRARARRAHFDSKGQVGSLSEVNARILPGTPVEVAQGLREPAKGFFRGVRSDAEGDYVLLETPNADGTVTMRAYRGAAWVRTQGYKAGALIDGAEALYAAPDAP
jgi:hypothetical protein